MFELLKKKIADFSSQLKHTIVQKETNTLQGKETDKPKPNEREAEQTAIEQTPAVFAEKTEIQAIQPQAKGQAKKEPVKKISRPDFEPAEPKRKLSPKIGIVEKAKAVFSGEITLNPNDLTQLLSEFELSLLEADVNQDTAEKIVQAISNRLNGKKIQSRENIDAWVSREIKQALKELLEVPAPARLFEQANTQKPFIILLLGPNGAGKTTTLAKLGHQFQKQSKSVIFAAADTFRAASIEQLDSHAKRLNVKLVKHAYGADPAAVGFDAISSAKAHGIDIVLIDSAGRQETNKNLMQELEKIVRVCKPDLKLYVMEAYTGQASLGQVKEFDSRLHVDGLILTKMDADPKGGVALTVLQELKKPVYYIGTGQEYEDLVEFSLDDILDKIV